MNPQVQIEHGDVGPNVAHLLLSSAPDFFDPSSTVGVVISGDFGRKSLFLPPHQNLWVS